MGDLSRRLVDHTNDVKLEIMKSYVTLLAALAVILSAPGCAIGIGNRDNDDARKASLGQELMDLKAARETGAMTEDEYQDQRARLLHD